MHRVSTAFALASLCCAVCAVSISAAAQSVYATQPTVYDSNADLSNNMVLLNQTFAAMGMKA